MNRRPTVVLFSKILAVGSRATYVRHLDGREFWIPNQFILQRPRPQAGDYNAYLHLPRWYAESIRSEAGTGPAAHTPGQAPGATPDAAQDARGAVGSTNHVPARTDTVPGHVEQDQRGGSPTALRAGSSSTPS